MTFIRTLRLTSPATLDADGAAYPCTIGRGGIAALGAKREGDLKTPTGRFALRQCYFRPDRINPSPVTLLPLIPLTPSDGWCDGHGSAIFMHIMRDDGVGTEGCIALKRADLLALLPRLSVETVLVVKS